MPHYKDGTPVMVGDVARGMTHSHPYPVAGVVTQIWPGAEQCNIEVAHTVPVSQRPDGSIFAVEQSVGDADQFEKVA